MTFKKCF